MRSLGAKQLIVLGACVVTNVLLGFVSTSPSSRVAPQEPQVQTLSLDELIHSERDVLDPAMAGVIASFEQMISAEQDVVRRGMVYDSLIDYLDNNRKFILASFYSEEKARANSGSSADWMMAGERYRRAGTFQTDPSRKPALYGEAIRCFEKSLQLDPRNLDAKVGLGITKVDGTSDPMSGVTMLKEVLAADSLHIDAELALAEFDIRSNQLDFAITRFNKVLRQRPDMYALHLSLAEVYGAKNDTAMVLVHLKAYSSVTDDAVMKAAIDEDIKTLEQK